MRHMSANRQWKVVDERYSGNVFTDDHWYSTHIPRIVRVKTTQTTQKIRKTAQYCANFYAKPSFELLKTWNRVKHRCGEHRRTTAKVPRQKNWWNAQIADVSRKTQNLCVIHAFTRILGSVTGPLGNGMSVSAKPLLQPMLTVNKTLTNKVQWNLNWNIIISIKNDAFLICWWRQAFICTNAGILLIRSLGTNFSEISIKSQQF